MTANHPTPEEVQAMWQHYLGENIGKFLVALDEYEGYEDDGHQYGFEAIEWATEKFKEIFRVKDEE